MLLLRPEDIDNRLNWTLGRAERLARRGALPHVLLPDRSIRFHWHEIEACLQHVAAAGPDSSDAAEAAPSAMSDRSLAADQHGAASSGEPTGPQTKDLTDGRQHLSARPVAGCLPVNLDKLFDDPNGFVPRLIRKKARCLAARPEFRGMDEGDLAQDLTCDLVRRLPRFNPARGKFTTFLFRVLRREMADLVQKATARKRRGRRPEHGLGELPLDETRARRHRGTTSCDPRRDFELNHDMARVAEQLSPHLRERCEMLMEGLSPSAIAAAKGIPLEAVTQDVERIRRHFVDHDLDGYL